MSSSRKKSSPGKGESTAEDTTTGTDTMNVGHNDDLGTETDNTIHQQIQDTSEHRGKDDEEDSPVASPSDFLAMALGMGGATTSTPTAKDAIATSRSHSHDAEDEEDQLAFSNDIHMKAGDTGASSFLSPPTRTKFFQLAKDVKTPVSKGNNTIKEHTGGIYFIIIITLVGT